jgi:hypothetical protein
VDGVDGRWIDVGGALVWPANPWIRPYLPQSAFRSDYRADRAPPVHRPAGSALCERLVQKV